MRKNKLALAGLAVCIFGLGLETGIVLTKCAMKRRGVIL